MDIKTNLLEEYINFVDNIKNVFQFHGLLSISFK